MSRADRPHGCPHCRCTWDTQDHMGTVNKNAEFYPLVALIDSLNCPTGPRSAPHRKHALDNTEAAA